MRAAKSFAEFEEAWADFLSRVDRVWNKTEAHYSRSPKWHGWGGKYSALRTKDPLLSYLVQARNVDEHGIANVVEESPGSVSIGVGPKGWARYKNLTIHNGNVSFEAEGDPLVVVQPARPRLVPVANRGRKFDVPTSHLGNAVDHDDVIKLADTALRFYEDLLSAAETFFVK